MYMCTKLCNFQLLKLSCDYIAGGFVNLELVLQRERVQNVCVVVVVVENIQRRRRAAQ